MPYFSGHLSAEESMCSGGIGRNGSELAVGSLLRCAYRNVALELGWGVKHDNSIGNPAHKMRCDRRLALGENYSSKLAVLKCELEEIDAI